MMRPTALTLSLLIATATVAGCGDATSNAPSVRAEQKDVEFVVPARGELVASESLPIALPGVVRMAFNIAWIAPEFSDIRQGDVIARFDDVQIQLDREASALAVAKSEFKLANTERSGEIELTRIGHEAERVDGERDISEAFTEVDPRLMSRNEIIDALSDIEYLDVQADFLDWQSATFDQRTQAEQNLIKAERQGELIKLEKQDKALGMMELRSPADGTLVYARTPWGEKIGKGKRVFPGMPIGLLPVRGKVKARLYVPENDAVGLLAGQTVRLRLDSAADREYSGVVESVSTVASPRNRDNPQKFFSVEALIDEVDPEIMRVGSQLRAEIITGSIDGGLVVPAQAVYGDASDSHVFVESGSGPERRNVTLGQRSPDLVEVLDGVEPGERISLVAPPDVG